jgi:acetyl-CoA carboxylase biotin carboxyl carrier protein
MVLESMKMEIPVTAPAAGRVTKIHVREGETVQEGQLLIEVE